MAYEGKTWIGKNPDGTIPSGAVPLSAKNLNSMEAGIKENSDAIIKVKQDLGNLKDGGIFDLLKGDVVWVNPNPELSFSAQIVNVDLSKYVRFSVLFRDYTNNDIYVEYQVTHKGYKYYFDVSDGHSTSYTYGRYITFTDEQINFSTSVRGGTENSGYTYYAIPVEIIGYKY